MSWFLSTDDCKSSLSLTNVFQVSEKVLQSDNTVLNPQKHYLAQNKFPQAYAKIRSEKWGIT